MKQNIKTRRDGTRTRAARERSRAYRAARRDKYSTTTDNPATERKQIHELRVWANGVAQ